MRLVEKFLKKFIRMPSKNKRNVSIHQRPVFIRMTICITPASLYHCKSVSMLSWTCNGFKLQVFSDQTDYIREAADAPASLKSNVRRDLKK